MTARRVRSGALLAAVGLVVAVAAAAQTTSAVPAGNPDAIIDLDSATGQSLASAAWRYHDAELAEVDFRAAGPDRKPSGAPVRTHDLRPAASEVVAAGFDDSTWERIAPSALDGRRSNGKLAFGWYRTTVTLPDRVGNTPIAGGAVVFEIVVDDYAEVWVNGTLPTVLGAVGGPLAAGYNAPNRVLLTRDARPGQLFTIAVFAANGPLSAPPPNYVWVRSATLDVYRAGRVGVGAPVETTIDRRDPGLDAILPAGAKIERVASGFQFTEGPVWVRAADRLPGYLLFSDPNANTIYRWSQDGQVAVFRTKSGYKGADVGEYHQPGSNGLTLDHDGRLLIDEQGNRRVTRLEKNGQLTVLADRFEGKRLNSPNDLVSRSDGTLYITDPPFGLPNFHDDPRRELPFSAVFALNDGVLRAVSKDLTGPNGLAFSPDEKTFYVTNWDPAKKVVMAYDVLTDGSLAKGRVFFDMTDAPGEEALDGMKIDRAGNLYVSGPGGLWILSPSAKLLGIVRGPEVPANFAWGDDDGKTLYMTARTGIYRLRLLVEGIRP
jgi:gluconolactonase